MCSSRRLSRTCVVAKLVLMSAANIVIWNVCSLNTRARRSVIREFLL